MSPLIFFVDEINLHLINRDAKVYQFIDHDRKEWDLHSIATFLPSNVLANIKEILASSLEDRVCLGFSQDDKFLLKSTIWAMRKPSNHLQSNILNWIWKLKLLPKIKIFLWLIIRNALPTCEFLSIRNIEFPNRCYICSQNFENIDHVSKSCPFVGIKLNIIASLIS